MCSECCSVTETHFCDACWLEVHTSVALAKHKRVYFAVGRNRRLDALKVGHVAVHCACVSAVAASVRAPTCVALGRRQRLGEPDGFMSERCALSAPGKTSLLSHTGQSLWTISETRPGITTPLARRCTAGELSFHMLVSCVGIQPVL